MDFIAIFAFQSLLSGMNQVVDVTDFPPYADLVGLTWEQIAAAFPNRLQTLASETYSSVQAATVESDVMKAFGADSGPAPALTPGEQLKCLRDVLKDRYVSAPDEFRFHLSRFQLLEYSCVFSASMVIDFLVLRLKCCCFARSKS